VRTVNWLTNIGSVPLSVPRLRQGRYTPSFFNVHIVSRPAIDEVLHLAGSYHGLAALKKFVANLRTEITEERLSCINQKIAELQAATRTGYQQQNAVQDPVLMHAAGENDGVFMLPGETESQNDHCLVERSSVPYLHPSAGHSNADEFERVSLSTLRSVR
jgi:hypothetical protein